MISAQEALPRNERERKEEAPKVPEKPADPRETGKQMRQEGTRLTDDVMESIDSAWDAAESLGETGAETELESLRDQAIDAKKELDDSLGEIDSGWTEDEEKAPDTVREDSAAETAELGEKEFEAVQEAARLAEDVLNSDEGYFEGLETLSSMAAENPAKRQEILKLMKERLGNRAAEILDSPELRRDLAGMQERLGGRWGNENGPQIATELTLVRLLGLRETMGSNPEQFVSVIDMKRRLEAAGNPDTSDYSGGQEILNIMESKVDPETGELTVRVEANFMHDGAIVTREFSRSVEKGKDGKPRVRKSVEHSLLLLPEHMKANGLAADLTRDSLAEYDKMGVDEVTLHADIDMGSYAWAAYGYGWDKQGMAEAFMKSRNNEESEIEVGGGVKKVKDLTLDEKSSLLESNREELALKEVVSVVKKGREKIQSWLIDSGLAEAGPLLAELDALEKNPLTVTPQTMAELGRSGPKFYRDENSTWYNEATLAEAVTDGRITAKEAEDAKKKPFHAGKIALQDNSWFGAIDLKPDGDQGGMNRKMLEKYLAKSSNKSQ